MIITESIIENPDGSITEMIFIDDENGKGYSMAKAVYDAQMEHLTEIVPGDEPAVKPE